MGEDERFLTGDLSPGANVIKLFLSVIYGQKSFITLGPGSSLSDLSFCGNSSGCASACSAGSISG